MARKILITGAAGLIGREIYRQLSKNNQVVAIDNDFRYGVYLSEMNYVKQDLKEYLSSVDNDFDYVFHMAAINGTKYFYEIPTTVIENNITSDLAVFEFMKKNSRSKLIYASSSEVVAGTDSFPTAEEIDVKIKDIHNSRWSYRIPKLLAENYLFNSDINFLIVRFFNVYSEHSAEGHFVYDIVKNINAGKNEIIGYDETRSFCYVEDAISALVRIYEKQSRDIFNIGSDEELKIIDAANIIATKLQKKVQWKCVSGRPGSVQRRKPDLSKLRNAIGFFSPRSFEQIINEKFNDRF